MAAEYQFDDQFDITEEVKEQFNKHGYIIVKGLLDSGDLAQIKKVIEDNDCITKTAYGLPDGDGRESKLALWSHPGSDVTGMLARCEKVAGFAEKLLEGEVYHYHSKLMMKEPRTGGKHIWHQDYGYWYKNGCLFPDMLSVFIPVDRAIKENGCLEILDGSHRCGRIDHIIKGGQTAADMDRVNELRKVCQHMYVEMDPGLYCLPKMDFTSPSINLPGDALFFHCNLLHTSGVNDSPLRRWVLIPCYNKATNNPVIKHHHPQYTKLHKVPNSAIKECTNYNDMTGKEFIERSIDKTVKVGTVHGEKK